MPLENKWCEKAFMCESILLSFKGYIKVDFLSESAFDSLSLLQTPLVILVLQDTMSWDDFPGSFISYLFFRSIPHRYFQFIFLLADLGSQIFSFSFLYPWSIQWPSFLFVCQQLWPFGKLKCPKYCLGVISLDSPQLCLRTSRLLNLSVIINSKIICPN